MENQTNNRATLAIAAVRNAIKDIRILIWAGNYQEARRIIESTYSDYEEELREAFALRKHVVKYELDIRKEIPDDGKPITEQQLIAMQIASEKSREIIGERVDYFSLGVLANILSKLDKRISDQTNQKTSIPKDFLKSKTEKRGKQESFLEETMGNSLFGFEYVLIPLGENKWELRAYRSQNLPDVNLNIVVSHLKHIENLNIHRSTSAKDIKGEDIFPHRYVGFSENSHVEITIFELNRLRIYLATENPIEPMEIFEKVLHAFN
ncbi:MAG: hypothetical protein IPP66_13595 [Anaerolineales bacterium]|nr:hypothetical protein [Anaerolineales bacterium]